MKKITLLFTIIPLFSYSQISGIGPFKINKTTVSAIDSLAHEYHIKVKSKIINSYSLAKLSFLNKNKPDKIIILIADTLASDYSPGDDVFEQKNTQTFYINYLNISGIKAKNIILTFYNDTLVRYKSNMDDDFLKALIIKYGNPQTKTDENKIECENGYGATFEHTETTINSTWDTQMDDITATAIQVNWYDKTCDLVSLNEFTLEYKPVIDIIKNADSSLYNQRLREKENNKKSSLKDF